MFHRSCWCFSVTRQLFVLILSLVLCPYSTSKGEMWCSYVGKVPCCTTWGCDWGSERLWAVWKMWSNSSQGLLCCCNSSFHRCHTRWRLSSSCQNMASVISSFMWDSGQYGIKPASTLSAIGTDFKGPLIWWQKQIQQDHFLEGRYENVWTTYKNIGGNL